MVEPACAVALAAVYSGGIARLQQEGVIPRPANICILVTGGRNINRQTIDSLEKAISVNSASATLHNVTGVGSSMFANGPSNTSSLYGVRHHIFGTEAILAEIDHDENAGDTSDMQTSPVPDLNPGGTVDINKESDESPSPSISMRS